MIALLRRIRVAQGLNWVKFGKSEDSSRGLILEHADRNPHTYRNRANAHPPVVDFDPQLPPRTAGGNTEHSKPRAARINRKEAAFAGCGLGARLARGRAGGPGCAAGGAAIRAGAVLFNRPAGCHSAGTPAPHGERPPAPVTPGAPGGHPPGSGSLRASSRVLWLRD